MISANNVTLRIGKKALFEDVNIKFTEGNCYGLIGANGAGKTSILRTISGLVRPSAGKIEFLGQEIQKEPARKIVASGLSQVPEGRHVFPGLTVMENLEMGAFLKKNREENQANLKKVFSRFPRLEERKNQDAATLSGGEQQRVSIARALAKNPKLLLCDEPTGALDSFTSSEIMGIFKELNRSGKTVIVVTHNLEIVKVMKKRVITVKKGTIVSDSKEGGYDDEN